jgi:hypothetical protein
MSPIFCTRGLERQKGKGEGGGRRGRVGGGKGVKEDEKERKWGLTIV